MDAIFSIQKWQFVDSESYRLQKTEFDFWISQLL